jgi:predicted ribosomally synthesized peptide with SipW-like signal peptide
MNEQRKNNGRGIFYGVIGVATLVVAIIGATFAYFTATGNDNGTITGNMATITFSLNVTKVCKKNWRRSPIINILHNRAIR